MKITVFHFSTLNHLNDVHQSRIIVYRIVFTVNIIKHVLQIHGKPVWVLSVLSLLHFVLSDQLSVSRSDPKFDKTVVD